MKGKATTKEEVAVEAFETIQASFLDDVFSRCTVVMEDIPRELIINWDHTGLHYVLVSLWSMEKKVVHVCQLQALMIKGNLQLYRYIQ